MSEIAPTGGDIEQDFHRGFGDAEPTAEVPIEPAAAEVGDSPPEASNPTNQEQLSPDQITQKIHESFGQNGVEASNLLDVESMYGQPIDAGQAMEWTAGLSTEQLSNLRDLYATNGSHPHIDRLDWVIGLRRYHEANGSRDPNAIGYTEFPG